MNRTSISILQLMLHSTHILTPLLNAKMENIFEESEVQNLITESGSQLERNYLDVEMEDDCYSNSLYIKEGSNDKPKILYGKQSKTAMQTVSLENLKKSMDDLHEKLNFVAGGMQMLLLEFQKLKSAEWKDDSQPHGLSNKTTSSDIILSQSHSKLTIEFCKYLHNGKEIPLNLPEDIVLLIRGATRKRSVVTIMLKYFYSILELRQLTLTGRTRALPSDPHNVMQSLASQLEDSSDNTLSMLPFDKLNIIQAVVMEKWPIKGTVGTALCYKAQKKQIKLVRKLITASLQYFKDRFDANGNIRDNISNKRSKASKCSGRNRSMQYKKPQNSRDENDTIFSSDNEVTLTSNEHEDSPLTE